MSPHEVLRVALKGQQLGCREALFVLGERPEERYPEARRWLDERKYDSTVEYLFEMCKLVVQETALYPHSNPGNLTRLELQALKEVNASLGLMLESSSERLSEPGGPHERAPSKRPRLRLSTLKEGGELKIPFTTGLLIGIGETAQERIECLTAIGDLQRRYGHIQEVIIQNFRAKPKTSMSRAEEPSLAEMLQTVAQARILLGQEMNIQAPPNLSWPYHPSAHLEYLSAGINDWGGISPLTIDYVNPEAPWPYIAKLNKQMAAEGFELRARFPIYPEYIFKGCGFLSGSLKDRLIAEADPQGYIPSPVWYHSPTSTLDSQH